MNTNNNLTIVVANNSDEALRQWVPPGCTTFFVIFSENRMILRSTDFRNLPSQPRFFTLTEEFYNQVQTVPQTNQNGDSNYVSKAEFDELKALIISSLNNPQTNNPTTNKEQGYKNNKQRGGNN